MLLYMYIARYLISLDILLFDFKATISLIQQLFLWFAGPIACFFLNILTEILTIVHLRSSD